MTRSATATATRSPAAARPERHVLVARRNTVVS